MNLQADHEFVRGVVAIPTTPFPPGGGVDEAACQRGVRLAAETRGRVTELLEIWGRLK